VDLQEYNSSVISVIWLYIIRYVYTLGNYVVLGTTVNLLFDKSKYTNF